MALHTPYRVVPYTLDGFISLLAEVSTSTNAKVTSKQHASYLHEYLANLGAKTIVLESRYIDHDYLEDYAGYYVRCFSRYRRTTSRLHFFSNKFDARQFKSVIVSGSKSRLLSKLTDGYLGFIVVKPLPKTIIGRTCLKTYSSDGGRRNFPTLHKYNANLFGIPLSVHSLAYQEQDLVVAACATSALWSVFQGSGKIFHHPIPSPVEITKAGSLHIPDGNLPHDTRGLHHNGLTATQMAHAVRAVGIDPYLVGAYNDYLLKCTAYAYLKASIPALLGFSLDEIHNNVVTRQMGKHAVAVTGFSLGNAQPAPFSNNNMLITASRIDKIYVHDDQIGPFAKMIFHPQNTLLTSWPDSNGVKGNVFARPEMLIIPLYHKIRIPFQIIHANMAEFDAGLEVLRTQNFVPLNTRIEWDIYLCEVNAFKSEIALNDVLDDSTKKNLLTLNMPRYLWRATGLDGNIPKFEVLFDATDIEQGAIIITVIVYDPILKATLVSLYPTLAAVPLYQNAIMIFQKIHSPPSFKAIE